MNAPKSKAEVIAHYTEFLEQARAAAVQNPPKPLTADVDAVIDDLFDRAGWPPVKLP